MLEKVLVTRSSMPSFEEYTEMIKPLWESHWLTNMGTYHKQLEAKLREALKVPELSLMVNGHMALELAIQSFGFPTGAEVITTPFTFISTTHAIVRNGLSPIFCDVKPNDGTIDEEKIEDLITEKTVAIVPVHVYGHICNVDKIDYIAKKYNLKVIYDAAHAFGIEYNGVGVGSYGDASIFSFHATKVFNTIEGGAVTFKDHAIYEKLYNLKNFGIRGEELVSEVGANAKMNEFCAAFGLCNLRHFQEAISWRKKAAKHYTEMLSGRKGIVVFSGSEDYQSNHNYAYYPILITGERGMDRNEVYEKLKDNDVFSRKYFYPLTSDQACFKNKYRNINVPVARKLAEQVLVLPIYEGITDEIIDRIVGLILEGA
ncbi:DegT/DnrJ/EryC1/StrS family aminotransferase [Butyrivibrio sp.]|uniref:DegT/DnrJ/EryC1/StrS family aminotransferase n=1 Tax=Butyrivibrio sp. TaxID=28121 RepID=UPI0025B94171|nr:DegT/DnrJ/EryC1/StrS family aminotransferase [Butyrivibrio sp.]